MDAVCLACHGGAMSEERALSTQIAAAYDAAPYEPGPSPWLAPAALLSVAAPFGATGPLDAVLDLGCGSGVVLEQAAATAGGPLVGYDLSTEAVRRANERLGDRARVIQANLLDLDPAEAGQFDLIYCVGVFYVTPPQVAEQIVQLIGKCLRPGGIALVSYYAGAVGAQRTQLARLLRNRLGFRGPPAMLVAEGRRQLASVQRTITEHATATPLTLRAIADLQSAADVIFYHEVFSPSFELVQTSQLAGALATAGVGFATYLAPAPTFGGGDSAGRAMVADALDLNGGGYRYAMFVKAT
jgi:SAM-dependent methyltransferase